MFRLIQRTQMDGHECRLVLAQNIQCETSLRLVGDAARVISRKIRPEGLLHLREHSLGAETARR